MPYDPQSPIFAALIAGSVIRRTTSPAVGTNSGRPDLMVSAMSWIYLVFAGLFEVVWAYFMKQSEGFTRLTPTLITIVAMVASFGLLAVSMRNLPLSTAYTVWTGIGAIGSFFVGILLLGEAVSPMRMLAVVLIAAGLLLMKLF